MVKDQAHQVQLKKLAENKKGMIRILKSVLKGLLKKWLKIWEEPLSNTKSMFPRINKKDFGKF